MESLLRRMLLINRISLMLAIVFILIINVTRAVPLRQDQVPKWVTGEDYYTKLRNFSGNSLAAMSLASNGTELFIGAKNTFYVLSLNETAFASPESVRTVPWASDDNAVGMCTMKGKQVWECQNFIQIVLRNDETQRLLVCGTNAWAPSCRNFEANSWTEYEHFLGTHRCPFSPTQKSTAIFAGGALYSATVKSFTAVDSVILRSLKGPNIASREVDANWLKLPEFINSFDVEDMVLFFFREVAVENSGEVIYSRVAKLCKSDNGGDWVLENTWTTYQKARLNCSFPGAFPFYFNHLQDVYMIGEGDATTFYAVFTTGDHAIPGSAVCAFSLTTIKDIFSKGQFTEQVKGTRTYYPVPADQVPAVRPGNCSLDSKAQPGPSLTFIADHPIMHRAVPSHGDDKPRFDLTRADNRLAQVVAHQKRGTNRKIYDVLFLGTDDGRVMKVVIVHGSDGQYQSNLLEEIYIAPPSEPEGVVNMELMRNSDGVEMILVNTNSKVVEMPLQRCSNLSACACVQDPYCVLNNLSDLCIPYDGNNYDSQDVDDIRDCPKEVPVPQTTTPVECLCPTTQPWVSAAVDLTTSLLQTTSVTTATTTRTSEPITTPSKGTPSETTEGAITTPQSTTTMSNEIRQGKTTSKRPLTKEVNVVDPLVGGSVGKPEGTPWALFWTFFVMGWIIAVLLIVFVIHLYVNKRCKGNYQPTDTDESVFGSSFKPSPNIVKTIPPTENGKPPLMTSMQESPVKPNGSLPQSRTHSLTPSAAERGSPYTDPKQRNSNGSYRPPNGAFSYGVNLTPYQADTRQPTTGGLAVDLDSPQYRLPSESDSRPSASGASDTELYADDSEIWLKRADGTDFGQEDEV